MTTVLVECITEEQRSMVPFLWSKGLNIKDIHKKKVFSDYGGNFLSRKAAHRWVKKLPFWWQKFR
jgi:hypothetical protein